MPVWLIGLSGRIAVLFGLAMVSAHGVTVWILFLAYAVSLAVSEPAERAIVGDHAHAEQRGTAFGLYHLACGLLALPGAFLFGTIWQYATSAAAFIAAGTVTAVASMALIVLTRRPS
jgi:MFS-type transporter involved in bile tolerance (Atg22 family)